MYNLKKIVYSFLFVIGSLTLFSAVNAQFHYFNVTNLSGYQQGCEENIKIYYDTDGEDVGSSKIMLKLDKTKFIYYTGTNQVALRSTLLTRALAGGFSFYMNPTAGTNPQWDATYSDSTYDALSAQIRNSDGSTTNGNFHLYNVVFKPRFDQNQYDGDFVFENPAGFYVTALYDPLNNDLTNASDQNTRLTGTITVLREPCSADGSAPTIGLSYTHGATMVSNNGINITLTEPGNNSETPFVRTGGGVGVGDWTGDYSGNPWGTNHQRGVNISTFTFNINGGSGNSINESWTNSDFDSVVISEKTWMYEDRDYTLTDNLIGLDFGIEDPVTITVSVDDRVSNSANKTVIFNNPDSPDFLNKQPINSFNNLTVPISFRVTDDWAGVNSGSIVVTLSGLNNAASGYRHVYSGVQLNSTLIGVAGLGNSGGYDVSFVPHMMPETGNINVHVYAEDLKGNSATTQWSFWTRPSCDDLSCCDPIILQTGYNLSVWTGFFTGDSLYVSGGDDAEFTWVTPYTGYIDCGTDDDGLSIYSGHGNDSSNATLVDYEEINSLFFSGTNVKVVLTGNNLDTFVLYRFGNLIIKAYPSNHILNNKGHDGKLYIYDPSDRTTPLYTGYLAMGTGVNGGTGAFVLDIPDGYYDIVYKARNGLASFLSGEAIQAGQTQIIDFTTGSNLYGTVVGSMPDWGVAGEMYQVVGDMPSTTQLNDLIDVGDVVNLISYNNYGSATYVADEYDYYDLNGDSSVELADVTTILSNVGQKGVFYGGSGGTYGFDSNGAW